MRKQQVIQSFVLDYFIGTVSRGEQQGIPDSVVVVVMVYVVSSLLRDQYVGGMNNFSKWYVMIIFSTILSEYNGNVVICEVASARK